MFPLHAKSSALGFIMTNRGLIYYNDAVQKVLSFIVITFEVKRADVHMAMLLLFYRLPGHQPCTNLVDPEAVTE